MHSGKFWHNYVCSLYVLRRVRIPHKMLIESSTCQHRKLIYVGSVTSHIYIRYRYELSFLKPIVLWFNGIMLNPDTHFSTVVKKNIVSTIFIRQQTTPKQCVIMVIKLRLLSALLVHKFHLLFHQMISIYRSSFYWNFIKNFAFLFTISNEYSQWNLTILYRKV